MPDQRQEQAWPVCGFSGRVPASLVPNRLATAVARLRAAGAPLLDLTVSNPTAVGFEYPPGLVNALDDVQALQYQPHAFGLEVAREAVAGECRRRGGGTTAEQVILTASTSEGYGYLFKLLCNPGDDVLVPAPSYPLFEHLSRLDAVDARPYPLEYHGVWSIDLETLGRAIGPRTRAVVVVAPNNPTGSYIRREQLAQLLRICETRRIPLICDEVFLDYPLDPAPDAVVGVLSAVSRGEGSPIVTLGGLSKAVGLPQHKLGWMVLDGPRAWIDEAKGRLELICDTYLSVSTPVQIALPRLLEEGARVRAAIAERLARNHEALRDRAARAPASDVLRVEGGWSAVVRVPAVRSEERLVLDLLEDDGVFVQPGFFFDLATEAYVVMSLLPVPSVFDEGIDRLFRRVVT